MANPAVTSTDDYDANAESETYDTYDAEQNEPKTPRTPKSATTSINWNSLKRKNQKSHSNSRLQ